VVHSCSQPFSRNGPSSPSPRRHPLPRKNPQRLKWRRRDTKFYYLYMKFIISSDRLWGVQRQWRGPSSSFLCPSFLRRVLASSRRRSNLSFLNFLLISYLPRNRDRRIKRMSRRSPKCIGTQTECRPSFFALPPRRRALSHPFKPRLSESAIPSFFVFFLRFVSFTWPRCYRSAEERHFSANVHCILRMHKKEWWHGILNHRRWNDQRL